jgi:hypothetical protein
MFNFVDKTANPIGGDCYNCVYCYIHGNKGMKYRFPHLKKKYSGEFKLYPHIFETKYKEGETVFFCDCIDYLHDKVPRRFIRQIFEWIERHPKTSFLSLTKNPQRYLDLIDDIPSNIILGSTIESNVNYPNYSDAPSQKLRLRAMYDIVNSSTKLYQIPKDFEHLPIMISIEPILDFDFSFVDIIARIIRTGRMKDNYVVVGYDNYGYKLLEPRLDKTELLIGELRKRGIRVIEKSLRKAWFEK